jgi:hypothetical protein
VFTEVSGHEASISAAELPSGQMQVHDVKMPYFAVFLVDRDVSRAYQLVAERNTNWASGCV